ncbi:MAG: D-alanine--D-alanine ligase [Phycisphaerae bacterium]|jgi:D-alanine--D-alanine ligase|nr:D-alanine--D-alanine ligase [Phycisphaerae bacterium]
MDEIVAAKDGVVIELPKTARTLDITVLMGGPSSERDISLLSGAAIAAGLESAGHHVTRADISPQDTTALDREGADVVFIALHGDFGESGEVQALCEDRGLRYTGSNERASHLGMDKAATKQILKRGGLITPDWMIVEEYHSSSQIAAWLEELPLPVVLKPVDGGSSVDVKIVTSAEQRAEAMEYLLDKYSRAMLEHYMPGREFTVGIIGNSPLPVMEIVPDGEFYDYRAKYDDEASTAYVFAHGLDEKTVARMQDDAVNAHRILGCRDVSRVDFILDSDNTPNVLEINTIPGFTSHSLVPKAAAAVGISFEQLVDGIVAMAMNR